VRTILAVLLAACSEYDITAPAAPAPLVAEPEVVVPPPDEPADVPLGSVTGQVCAPGTNDWVAGAVATIVHDLGESTDVTDGEGRFLLTGVPEGHHTVDVVKGSFTASFGVNVTPDETAEIALEECIGLEQDDVTIAVVTGLYDDIGTLLDYLDLQYDVFDGVDPGNEAVDLLRDPALLATYDIVFFNCGMTFEWTTWQDEVGANVAEYVRNGGSVYASDWAYYVVEAAYPDDFEFVNDDAVLGDAFVGVADSVVATVIDPAMADLLGSTSADLNFDLDAWVPMSGTRAEVLLEGEFEIYKGLFSTTTKSGPLATRLHDGDGEILYTSFHNERQSTQDMATLLQEIILSL
jgi:hypothetical protein